MANAFPSRLVDSVNGQGGEVIITENDNKLVVYGVQSPNLTTPDKNGLLEYLNINGVVKGDIETLFYSIQSGGDSTFIADGGASAYHWQLLKLANGNLLVTGGGTAIKKNVEGTVSWVEESTSVITGNTYYRGLIENPINGDIYLSGTAVINTNGSFIYRFPGGNLTAAYETVATATTSETWGRLAIDPNGNVWVVRGDLGLEKNSGGSTAFISVTSPITDANCIAIKSNGNIYVNDRSTGIYESIDGGTTWNLIPNSYNSWQDIIIAEDGNLIGVIASDGVYKININGLGFTKLFTVVGSVVTIVKDNNGLIHGAVYGGDTFTEKVNPLSTLKIFALSGITSGTYGNNTTPLVSDNLIQISDFTSGLDLRASNLAGDLSTAEKDGIKTKLNITDTVYDDTAIQNEVDLNTAKDTNINHPLVEKAVPANALFTDTTYDENISVKRVLIPTTALPANFTSTDVKNWLNTNESIGDNEVLFWETTGEVVTVTLAVNILTPTEGQSITGDVNITFELFNNTGVNILTPTEGQSITGDVNITFEII